jgi:transcriptional regulator with XRE-family HTH domain
VREEEDKENRILKNLGERIRKIRLGKGIRQNEIAYRCHFDKSSYNNIEAGKRNMTILTLYKIANALDEPVENFFKTES